MIFDVYLLNEHIFKYLHRHDYIHKVWVFKQFIAYHDAEREKHIREYSAKTLNKRLRFNYYVDSLEFSPILSKLDLLLYLEDFIEDCLEEKLLTRCDMLRPYPIMKVSSHVLSHTIFYYGTGHRLPTDINFTETQLIINDVEICSTYRLGKVQRSILKKHYPYAKALIY